MVADKLNPVNKKPTFFYGLSRTWPEDTALYSIQTILNMMNYNEEKGSVFFKYM